MKILVRLLVGLCAAAMPIVCAQELPPLQAKAARLMRSGHLLSSAEMEVILGKERAEVLDLLRKVICSEVTEWVDGSRLNPSVAREVLLRLPDPEVLESIGNQVAEYQMVGPYGTVLDGLSAVALRSKQPKLLPYFAKSVFRDEDANTQDFEWVGGIKINRSMESLSHMLHFTYELQEFSPEVRAWARAMLTANHLPLSERRELGRAWWKENEKAILAGDYSAVRPGVSPAAGMPRPQPDASPDPSEAKRVLPVRSPVTTTNPESTSSAPGSTAVATTKADRLSWQPYLWACIATIVAGAAGWLFVRSKRRA